MVEIQAQTVIHLKMKRLLLLLFIANLTTVGFSQQLTAPTILRKADQACDSIKSVKYQVYRYHRQDTVVAEVIQQKAAVANIGFGNALVKVTGFRLTDGDTIRFAFSFDSLVFKLKNANNEVLMLENPNRNKVGELLSDSLDNLTVPHLGMNAGMNEFFGRKYTLFYKGWSEVRGEDTDLVSMLRKDSDPSTGRVKQYMSDWYFSQADFLPRRIKTPDGMIREIEILEIGEYLPRDLFDLEKSAK